MFFFTFISLDPALHHSWDNFRRAADMITIMHRRVKIRMERVLETSYKYGSVSFFKDFLCELERILKNSTEFRTNKVNVYSFIYFGSLFD